MVTTKINPATTCDDLTIILNNQLDKHIGIEWNLMLKKVYPDYILDNTWELNRTVIYNYNREKTFVFPLDIFMTKAVMVVSNSNDEIMKPIESVIKFLTSTIRDICPLVDVANTMSFTLNFYIHPNHKDDHTFHFNKYIKMVGENVEKTILGRSLPEKMRWYQIELRFKGDWTLEMTNMSNKCNCSQHINIRKCF